VRATTPYLWHRGPWLAVSHIMQATGVWACTRSSAGRVALSGRADRSSLSLRTPAGNAVQRQCSRRIIVCPTRLRYLIVPLGGLGGLRNEIQSSACDCGPWALVRGVRTWAEARFCGYRQGRGFGHRQLSAARGHHTAGECHCGFGRGRLVHVGRRSGRQGCASGDAGWLQARSPNG